MTPNSLIHGMGFIIGKGEKCSCGALCRLNQGQERGGGSHRTEARDESWEEKKERFKEGQDATD